MTSNFPYIVADIGGTNARFGLVTQNDKSAKTIPISNIQKFPSAACGSIEQAVKKYIATLGSTPIKGACLAVAGPVGTENILLTNLNWQFSVGQLKQSLNLEQLMIINDFSAYALATRQVSTENLIPIKAGQRIKSAPIAVIGPGTGFGVATLIPIATESQTRWKVIASEGGHATLPSQTDLQRAVINYLRKKLPLVTVESLFSGPGLSNLYEALATIRGIDFKPLNAFAISQLAKQDKNSLAYQTFDLFCNWLGQAASDIAITLGARGGVYLCGGIMKQNADQLLQSNFTQEFTKNPTMKGYCESIPIHLVSENNSALRGAAAWYQNECGVAEK